MTEPIGYLNYGWTFLRSAEHLHAACQQKSVKLAFPDAPPTLLVGHAVELMLKAFLWHSFQDQRKAADFKHGIQNALEASEKLGLKPSLTKDERDAFRLLDQYIGGQPYPARYLITGVGPRSPIEHWITTARRLMDAIEPRLDPMRVKNLGLRTTLEPPPRGPNAPLTEQDQLEHLRAMTGLD